MRRSPCADGMPAGRDLKSPNFLYMHNAESGTYRTLLADFGEVTSVEYLEGGGDSQEGLIGTPNWAAPEILTYPRRYSQSSDVFALALVVFECLAGETLGGEFLKRHSLDGQYFDFSQFTMQGGRPSLEELEPAHGAGVCTALARAWAQDAAARGTAAELAEGLEGGEVVQQDGTKGKGASTVEGRLPTMGNAAMEAPAAASRNEETAGARAEPPARARHPSQRPSAIPYVLEENGRQIQCLDLSEGLPPEPPTPSRRRSPTLTRAGKSPQVIDV